MIEYLVFIPVFAVGVLFGVLIEYRPVKNPRDDVKDREICRLRDRVTFLEDELRNARNWFYERYNAMLP